MPTRAFASPIRPALQISCAALTALFCTSACSDAADNGGQQTTSAGTMDISGLLDSGGLDTSVGDNSSSNDANPQAELPGLDALGNGSDSGGSDAGPKDADSSAKDASDVAAGSDFGKPCKSDTDCASGWCIEGYNGYFCSQTCAGQCPKGHVCQKVFAGDKQAVYLCVAPVNKLCKPCSSDLDCAGGACVGSNGESFCANPCGAGQAACPGSHQCQAITSPDGTPGPQVCMPKSGSCSCTPTSSGLVRACQQGAGPTTCYGIETCQNGKWGLCQLPAESCNGQDDDCDGVIDNGFVDGTGAYTTLKACGQCGINCLVLQAPHAQPVCASENGAASCKLACDSGFFDTNDNPKDGCECQKFSALDEPDGADQNCDGIDGEVDNGVFVALNGKDVAAGSQTSPLASIAAGIAKAKATGKRDVYVASGVYDGSLALVAGVHVYGGYSADFKAHDPQAYETVVLGGTFQVDLPGAINAANLIGSKATLDGFTVFGASTKTKGASTYGIFLRDCDAGLRIRGNKVIAGDAGGGKPGSAGSNGAAGLSGTPGGNAKDIGTFTCSTTHATSGGLGGVHSCGGVDVSGGGGGKAICPDYDEDGTQPKSSPYKQTLSAAEQGVSGKGAGGGKGGASGYDSLIWEGSSSVCGICVQPKAMDGADFLSGSGLNGSDGADGALGNAGSGCDGQSGKISGGLWTPGSAANGLGGAPGSGGGGGGAGGGVETTPGCKSDPAFKYPDLGGSGGGAGSGGCGASGGTAGGSGGGSFALFLTFSAVPSSLPQVSDNLLVTGNGGDGGSGGQGGVGGLGGDGKFGGADDPAKLAWCASAGGRGGQGGNGGHGGGGGGGCGGVAYGIFLAGSGAADASKLATANSVQLLGLPGLGGNGGKSLGKTGGDGSTGAGGATNW
jgi:hypothetical protein